MTLFLLGSTALARTLPDLGLILNDDAYSAYAKPTLSESVAHLQSTVDGYADGGVKTLCYSIGEGSEIIVYPTAVGSTWGWRPLPKYDDDPRYAERIERNRRAIAEGGDAIRVAGERAKQRGMLFIPSLRMNDPHFMADPLNSPFTGRFWLEHQDLKIGTSPIVSRASYGELLDFSHAEVRQHRLDQIFEAIDRYADLIDGFELDFNRFQVYFPPGEAHAKRNLITDLVKQVRAKLDAVEAKTGRPMVLIAHVAPTLASCDWAGLDVRDWMKRGLVDVVSPGQLMTMAYEMPADAFVAAAEGTEAKIFASILPRTVWRWTHGIGEPVKGKPSRAASQDQLRATAANMWSMGVDGLYLYNYRVGMLDDGVRDLRTADALRGTDKCFTVTKAYYLDHEDTYSNRKQLPTDILGDAATQVTLYVADDLASPNTPRFKAGLRLGTRGLAVDDTLSVTVNDQSVYTGPAKKVLAEMTEQQRGLVKSDDVAYQIVDLVIDRPEVFKVGRNAVAVRVAQAGSRAASDTKRLIDVELMVDYTDKPARPVTRRAASEASDVD